MLPSIWRSTKRSWPAKCWSNWPRVQRTLCCFGRGSLPSPAILGSKYFFRRRQSDAERIFAAARQFSGAGRVWLVNEAAGRAHNLPKGTLTVRVKQSMVGALRDGLAVAKAGLEFLGREFGVGNDEGPEKRKNDEALEEDDPVEPPLGCGNESRWTSTVGMRLFRQVIMSN
jgi:hypothetical protein